MSVVVVMVGTKVAISRDVDILVSGQWCQNVINEEKVTILAFKHLTRALNVTNRAFFLTIDHT